MKELLRKKYIKILLSLITLLVVIGIVGINVQSSQKSKEYEAHIAAAEKYLSDLDYEQAIAEYTKALEIDPKEEVVDALAQAYLDYAKSYADTGDYEKAASILEESYEKINPKEEIVDALEQAYLAYAQTYIEAEDYEKAVSVLKEKSEKTGWESLQNMIVEVKALQEQKRIEEEEKASGMVEFPFQMTDITVMGYDLFGDHFAHLKERLLTEGDVEFYEEDGEYPRGVGTTSDGWTFEIRGHTDEYGVPMYDIGGYNNELICGWWGYSVYYRSNGSQAYLYLERSGNGNVFDYAEINVPVKSGETYGDWCRVMQIDQIKESDLRPEERDGIVGIWKDDVCICTAPTPGEGSCEYWVFSTEWYQGIYSEYDIGNGIRYCTLDFSKPSVNEAREQWPIRKIGADINADGVIERISYVGWPIAE